MTHLILPNDPVKALDAWDAYVEKIKERDPPTKPSILGSIKSIFYKNTYALQVFKENFEFWKKEPFHDISNWDLILKERCFNHTYGIAIRVIYECMELYPDNKMTNVLWLRNRTKHFKSSYQQSVILGHYHGPNYDIGYPLELPSPELIDIAIGVKTEQLTRHLNSLHLEVKKHDLTDEHMLKHLIRYLFSRQRLHDALNTRDHNKIIQYYVYFERYLADVVKNTNNIFITTDAKITFCVGTLALLNYMLICKVRDENVRKILIKNKNLVTTQFKNVCPQEYAKYTTINSLGIGINFSTMLDSLTTGNAVVYNDTIEMPIL